MTISLEEAETKPIYSGFIFSRTDLSAISVENACMSRACCHNGTLTVKIGVVYQAI